MGIKKRTITLLLISTLLYPFSCENVHAQQQPNALISGLIIDEETIKPLENVIVFLANTFWGKSTDTLGKFILTNIESGEYDLIISRVGYIRQTKHLQVNKNDTLFYEIKLVAQPIQAGEVEILGERSESVKPNLNLFPMANDNAYCVYGNGESLPIGILFTDSALYMYALDTALVDSEKYIRLWLLYYNLMEQPFELNPVDCIKINVQGKNRIYKNIKPENKSSILQMIPNEGVVRIIKERVAQTIQTLLLFQKLIQPGYIRSRGINIDAKQGTDYDKSGKMEIRWNFQKDPALKGASTDYISSIYSLCVSDGLLKRHIVYPNNGVHGFLFFPYPGLEWKSTNNRFDEAFDNQYELEIITPTETKTIVFTPH